MNINNAENTTEQVNAIQHTATHFFISGVGIFIVCIAVTLPIVFFFINSLLNKILAKVSEDRPRVLNPDRKKKILIFGDSTAYGTGASTVEESIAGRFAHDFPSVQIINYAQNGARVSDVFGQLEQARDDTANLILISVGGNDAWRFTAYESVDENIRYILQRAKYLSSGRVILMLYNNSGSAPAFPFFMRSILLKKSKEINIILSNAAQDNHVSVAPVFFDELDIPKNFFSGDGLHPSGEGYRIWYGRLWAVLFEKMNEYELRD